MPPPQCPECGRFLAKAFVAQIRTEQAPCPRCGVELWLGEGDPPDGGAVQPAQGTDAPVVTADAPGADPVEAAAALEVAHDEDIVEDDAPRGAATDTVATRSADATATAAVEVPVDAPPIAVSDDAPAAANDDAPAAVNDDAHPLDDWDRGTTTTVTVAEPDTTELAVAVGVGTVLGSVLAGRRHRLPGAVFGGLLGALAQRLRS